MGYQESLIKVDKKSFDKMVNYLNKNENKLSLFIDVCSIVEFKDSVGEFKKGEKAICITGDREGQNKGFIFENNYKLGDKAKIMPIEVFNDNTLNKMFKTHELAKEIKFDSYVKGMEMEL